MRLVAAVSVALLLVVLTGCGSVPTVADQFTTVQYQRLGGIGGFDDQLTLERDREYRLMRKGTTIALGSVDRTKLKELKERLEQVSWPGLSPNYGDPRVANAVIETITLTTAKAVYQVKIGSGGTPPAELRGLADFLQEIVRESLAK